MTTYPSDIQIPNGYVHLWQSYLQAQGVQPQQLELSDSLQQYVQHVLSLPIDGQSSCQAFITLLEQTRQQLNTAYLVFELARFIRPEHFGVLGYMASRSNSVAEALQYIAQFSRLVIDANEAVPMQIQQQDDLLIVSWPNPQDQSTLIHEITFACMLQLARQMFAAEHFPLRRVHFAHAPQTALYQYQKFYGCEVLFDQPDYQLVLSIDSLQLQPQQPDPTLIGILKKQAEEAMAAKPLLEGLDQKLRHLIADYLRLQQQAPKLDELAVELCMSSRTLQRQLSELGTSFKQLLNMERIKRCELLLPQKLSLTEIASQLGYSDQSALARAYKAHCGQTLTERRRVLRQQQTTNKKRLNSRLEN
ncbi:AraC family transcriptional regulator ligand-binding domain-containing protein [Acinetobacter indicus]|uniref:helix-turn-helix domain-containing protein n=1 Tax=Acinetobacter indicus TaxID=756892 RepID=UPI0025775FDE|nr:AraC family transcriptional regulator [Acinetobacter indicus]MDM1310256.1 AraC family transcriptional regulator ligand-binding domain-containing protein [Acinetobacter indicus]